MPNKQMMHTAYLPIGGLHVTKDLAIGLSTTLIHAERLKTLFGNVESSPDDDREMLPVPLVGEEDHQLAKVPRSMVVNIIRPRIEETFEYIKDRLDQSGMGRAAGNRVVLTGGACQLPGVREMAARMLSRQVRLGRPAALRGLPELASGPAFSTAAGLLSLGSRRWPSLPGHQPGWRTASRSVPPTRQFFEGTCLSPARIESFVVISTQ